MQIVNVNVRDFFKSRMRTKVDVCMSRIGQVLVKIFLCKQKNVKDYVKYGADLPQICSLFSKILLEYLIYNVGSTCI